MTAEPPPGNPYQPQPPPGQPYDNPQGGGYGNPYGAPQGAPLPPGAPAPLAEWWERLVARIIDGVIFGIIYAILAAILPALLAGVIAYAAYAAYDYVLHSKDGQTLGKKVMKIRLAGLGGAVPDSSSVMKRSAIFPGVMVLYGIPILGWLSSIFVLVLGVLILVDKPLRQGLHDKLAGTVVVKAPR
ncbi:MAG: domain containing protein [Sphaerisporangium sp.]|jgi:uncharacterized RDD family membrane protein YckC|nr:domain containing protein [Sphaerisporangium sp.]